MNKLKVGIVGCGYVAQQRHIPSLLNLTKEVEISAVCDINEILAKNVATKFGIPNAYSELSEMLSNEELDIIDVCTPPRTHASVAVESLENGCHVLLEKPMSNDVSSCDKMIKVSIKTGQKLSIVHNQNFYPPFLKAKKIVDKGEIGELTGMRILQLTNKNVYMIHKDHWIHRLPGGFLGETGPHVIYMSLAFLNKINSVEVFARKTLNYPWVKYDDYRIDLNGENITSSIMIAHSNDFTLAEVDLFGRKCMLRIDLQGMLLFRYGRTGLNPKSIAYSSLKTATYMTKGVFLNTVKYFLKKPMLGHEIMISKFIESIKNDSPLPVTPQEGRETVKVMEMILNELNRKFNISYIM